MFARRLVGLLMVQADSADANRALKGYGFTQPDQGGKDVFVHISAVERSGMRGLVEGQRVSYEVQADRRTGKESAANLRAA